MRGGWGAGEGLGGGQEAALGRAPMSLQRAPAPPSLAEKAKKDGSECEDWRWGPCVPNSKDCGLGYREGTCKDESKKLKCKIPCNWKKKFGGGRMAAGELGSTLGWVAGAGTHAGSWPALMRLPSLPADCKYKFESWGGCSAQTGVKTRSGILKKALYNAQCEEIVYVTKPCSSKIKSKSKGQSPPLLSSEGSCWDPRQGFSKGSLVPRDWALLVVWGITEDALPSLSAHATAPKSGCWLGGMQALLGKILVPPQVTTSFGGTGISPSPQWGGAKHGFSWWGEAACRDAAPALCRAGRAGYVSATAAPRASVSCQRTH